MTVEPKAPRHKRSIPGAPPRVAGKSRQRAMVASAEPITAARASRKAMRFGDDEWQREAWRFYDLIGELRFAANWIGGAVSQCRLHIAQVTNDGEAGEEVRVGPIAQLARIPLGSGDRRDENLRLLGICLFVAGEGFIVGEGAKDDGESDRWWVTSSNTITQTGRIIEIERPREFGGGKVLLNDSRDMLIRVWTPHPKLPDQADSPVRAAIPVLTEMLLLLKREFAELESRLVGAGIQWLPEGIDFPKDDGEEGGLTGFVAKLAKIAEMGIDDQASASAMLPLFATIPDQFVEHIDKLRAATYWSELSEQLQSMKDGAIQRLALSLDMPAELLTGAADSSRWHAWLADEQVIKIHIRPILSRIAMPITGLWLSAALVAIGEDQFAYMFTFDTAALAVRPNRSEDALNLWDRGLVDDETARKAGAFGEDTKMSEVQRIKHLVMRAAEREPMLLLNPVLAEIIGIKGIEATLPVGVPEQDGRPREIEPDPPRNPRALPAGEDDQQAATTHTLHTGANLMVLRALELAGGRLTTQTDRKRRWVDVPKHMLHVKVGPQSPEVAGRALTGAWDHLGVLATSVGVDETGLREVLSGYCMELLTRGFAHDDDLLKVALKAAMRQHETVAA